MTCETKIGNCAYCENGARVEKDGKFWFECKKEVQ